MKPPTMLRIGDWFVDPVSSQITRNGEMLPLDVRSMRLLLCLADRAGDVVSIDDLLDHVWAGVSVTPDSVYQAVASLRRVLGDGPRQPTYIATVPRLGYKLVASVAPCVNQDPAPKPDQVLESLPPSPPEGPPLGTYFSLRKVTAPSPPLPALISTSV